MQPEAIALILTALGAGAIAKELFDWIKGSVTGRSARQRDENRRRVADAREASLDFDSERAWRRSWEDAYYQLLYVTREHLPRELHALIPPPPAPPARPPKESP